MQALTKKGPKINADGKVIVGAVDQTLKYMRNKTGSKIAVNILELRDNLTGYLEDIANIPNKTLKE